jgi:hypothetical protein
MEQIDREEERRAAEDFRRQLQERSLGDSPHPSAAEQFRWLNENDKLLERIARVNWGSASGEGLTPAQFKEELATVPLPSPHDEPFTHSIVHQLSQQIEGVCQEWRIPLRSGVAYGSNPILDVASPFQVGVPLTDASVISLSTGFIMFCNSISTMFALSLPHERDGDRLKVSFSPEIVLARLDLDAGLRSGWEKVISDYAFGLGPLSGDNRDVHFPASFTRMQLLSSMERFSLAHEYGHHVGRHGRAQDIGANGDADATGQQQELEADLFALSVDRYIGMRETRPNVFSVSGAAAALLLKCHDCVKRVRQILMTGEDTIPSDGVHPGTAARIAAFDNLDYQLPEHERTNLRKIRGDCAEIVEEVYVRLKPMYIDMHEQGVRPSTSRQAFDPPRCLF